MNAIMNSAEWRAAQSQFLDEEKEVTEALDRLAARRRRLPWMAVEKTYRFIGTDGEKTLADLFDGREQLIVYHHMLRPQDPSPCTGCSMVGDQIPHIAHLNARRTSLAFVSRAPIAEIEAFRSRMGWGFPFYETTGDFNDDFDVADGFGLNVFIKTESGVYRTYFTSGRGVETLGTAFTLLDITPYGRQENWQDAPDGVPQDAPYQWWRLHDEYEAAAAHCGCHD